MLAAVRSLCADEAEFVRACCHRLRESYGPLFLVLRATSTRTMYRLLTRTTSYRLRKAPR